MTNNLFRTMSIDYGDKYIGLAVSDLTGLIANGLPTLTRTTLENDLKYIKNLIYDQNVKIIVFGLPINMDGTLGERVDKTKEFAKKLQEHINDSFIKIDYLDERLTTMQAEKVLLSADVSRQKRKQVIDKLSAVIILQDYLYINKRG